MADPVTTAQFGRPSVLVVEDDDLALEELIEMVQLDGRVAHFASSIEDAVAILDENPAIGIIVTDVHLIEPDGEATNGLDLVERCFARFPERAMSFIVQSGDATVAGTSIQTGAIDFLNKPLCADEFSARLKEAEDNLGHFRNGEETTKLLLAKVTTSGAELEVDRNDPLLFEVDKVSTSQKLRHAIRQGNIQPWFQPRIDLSNGTLSGFEALARWVEPDGIILAPATFLQVARANGLLGEVDQHLRKTALDAVGSFEDAGAVGSYIGIKITIHELATPSVVGAMLYELDTMHFDPSRIAIEVLETESLEGKLATPIRTNLERLTAAGVRIEFNDTGASHASFSKTGQLTLHRVKLGRQYIRDVHQNPDTQRATRNQIARAKAVGADVIACGVETQEELDWLIEEGCDLAQGFLIAPPMPEAEALDWAERTLGSAVKWRVAQ